MLFIDQLVRSKATCSFNQLKSNLKLRSIKKDSDKTVQQIAANIIKSALTRCGGFNFPLCSVFRKTKYGSITSCDACAQQAKVVHF